MSIPHKMPSTQMRQFKALGSVSTVNGLKKPGMLIREDEMPVDALRDALENGFLQDLSAQAKPIDYIPGARHEPSLSALNTHAESSQAMNENEEALARVREAEEKRAEMERLEKEKAAAQPPLIVSSPGGITTTSSAAPAPVDDVKTNGRWNFDPLMLNAKALEQLNAMIMERDPKTPPMPTKEEAVAFLSQDFGK